MTYTERVLATKQAKEAIGEGFLTWLQTGDFHTGWDAMIAKGKKNGSYPRVKIALLFDFFNSLGR